MATPADASISDLEGSSNPYETYVAELNTQEHFNATETLRD